MNDNTTRELPEVITRMKEAYSIWVISHRNFPKVERLGIGQKIELIFLDIIELTFCLSYMSPEQKIPFLSKAITKLDVLKFFIQFAWENKLIPTDKYSEFVLKFEEIGRQLGAWRKGLQSKI